MALTILKIRYRCVISAQIIILTCEVINVHRANIRIFSRLYRLVRCICMPINLMYLSSLITLILFSEILPLVEFSPENDIPEADVERLLMAPPKTDSNSFDPFVDTMINEEYSDIFPLTLDRDALRAINPTTILIAKWPPPMKTKYYRNLMPEWQISMCPECLQVSN